MQVKLETYIAAKNVAAINGLIDEITSEQRPLNESKPIINYLATHLKQLDNSSTLAVCEHAISKLRSRQLQFDEEDCLFKKEMAEVLVARQEYEQAARTLESINIEHTNRQVSSHEKAELWLQIAENWFEFDDSVNAEKYISKAAHVMHLV